MAELIRNFDLRFALDEEDAKEIAALVNQSYQNECEGQFAFRIPGEKTTEQQVQEDLSSSNVRWIVLESPYPEEVVMAALRLRMIDNDGVRESIIDIFASIDHMDVRNCLLAKCERICESQGSSKLVIYIPQWSYDLQDWLSGSGYFDLGGHEWPTEMSAHITKPTMILHFEKRFVPNVPLQRLDSTSNFIIAADIDAVVMDQLDIENNSFGDSEVQFLPSGDVPVNDTMHSLITDLFKALHSDPSII